MIKVSIIVPIYNSANYLNKCLDSLLSQTLKEIEIICVNDGSTDDSLEILENYARNDNRIIVISQENQGQGVARNNAIKIAKGEYLGFVDSDDWVDTTMFEKLYNTAKDMNAEIVHCDFYEVHDQTLFPISTTKYLKSKNINIKPYEAYNFDDKQEYIFKGITNLPWNRIYKKEMIQKNNISFAPTKYDEDNPFCVESLINTKKIIYIDEPLYFYLYRENSCTRTKEKPLKEMFVSLNEIRIKYFPENPKIQDAFDNYWVNLLFDEYLANIPLNNKLSGFKKCRETLTKTQENLFNKVLVKHMFKTFLKSFFSIKNKKNKNYKIIKFLGIVFEIKCKGGHLSE